MRERSIGLVGFGALVAAALGLSGDNLSGLAGAIGLSAFVVVTGCALFVVFPRATRYELGAKNMEQWFALPEVAERGLQFMIRSAAQAHGENHGAPGEVITDRAPAWPAIEQRNRTPALV